MSAKKQPRAKAVKAGLVHMDKAGRCWAYAGKDTKPVSVLDVSDPAALVEQAANTPVKGFNQVFYGKECARAILANLGIIPKRKAK